MTTYRLALEANGVVRSDGVFVPNDPLNIDWRVYEEWLANGGEPEIIAPPIECAPIPFSSFMALFIRAEQAALVNSEDTQVRLFLLQASGAGEIDLSDPRVIAALDYLTKAGVLAPGRAAAILGAAAP
jgi:hypothetical protein